MITKKQKYNLITELLELNKEEQSIMNGGDINRDIFNDDEITIDLHKIILSNDLIDMRKHTRFTHYPKHKHNYIECIYVLQGDAIHVIDGNKITLEKGDLMFLNQNTEHELLPAKQDDVIINFIINDKFFLDLMNYTKSNKHITNFFLNAVYKTYKRKTLIYKNIGDNENLEEIVYSIIFCIKNSSTLDLLKVKFYMGLLLVELMAIAPYTVGASIENTLHNKIVLEVLDYIKYHYREGNLNVIAEKLNQKNYYIAKLLKKYLNKNFKELVQNKRLEEATHMLISSNKPISEIIFNVGYENVSYFYKLFKKKYNMRPDEYRKRGNIR